MTPRSLLVSSAAVLGLTLLAPVGADAQVAAPATRQTPEAVTTRVLAISVDGFNTAAIRRLGSAGAPTMHRLLSEGAGTLNARSEHEQNVTLPNHTSMLTGRRIDRRHGGHGVTWDDDRPRMTVQKAARHRVRSVFDVVHAAGARTALFTTKTKFRLYQRSWPRTIDRFRAVEDQARLVRAARRDLLTGDRAFTFLHVSLPDRTGHEYGGMSAQYLDAVRTTDRQLGTIVDAIAADPALASSVSVVLTADHGFAVGQRSHTRRVLANYRIPFVAWGAGVGHGDLYALNPDYRDPGTTRPAYAARRQPVRNGDLANLALDLLGLRPVPGSTLDRSQDLDVR